MIKLNLKICANNYIIHKNIGNSNQNYICVTNFINIFLYSKNKIYYT